MSKIKDITTKGRPCPGKAPRTSTRSFQLPALSIPLKEPPLDPTLEKLKKRAIRRNAPAGEDLKKIKEIIRGLNKEGITVQEFVGLLSPYTSDNGNELKSVMIEDLANFRKMAKRIYDAMTQDVSDVLANEQIHITEYYTERHQLHTDKMMRTIDEIYRYVPNFDFESYYSNRSYLEMLFPLPKLDVDVLDADEMAMQKRQEAYHRLQWIRSEGIRLGEENATLQNRLRSLKRQQKDELTKTRQREEEAEMCKNQLESAQNKLKGQLEVLNESMERSIVENEQTTRMILDAQLAERAKEKQPTQRKQARKKEEPWNVKAAREIEMKGLQEAARSSALNTVPSKTGGERKARPRIKKKPVVSGETSPFHFSPTKTPPPGPSTAKETSPFHYSPPKTPIETRVPTKTVRVESTTTTIEQMPAEPTQQRETGRRGVAPKDAWRGFC
ncbi:hypothetical protein FQA39_LY02981 [Lamprigera yunnana]|nr:hypothetical protein FQA39_LY02981 [Lamprigera yunnana]